MVSAEDFIKVLEEKDLVPADLIVLLRQKVAESQIRSSGPPWNKPLTAARLAKWLVDNGHLSRLSAQRLLARAEGISEATTTPPGSPAKREPSRSPAEDDLGLAPLDDLDQSKRAAAKKHRPAPEPKAPQSTAPPAKSGASPAPSDEVPVATPVEFPPLESDALLPTAEPVAGGPLDGLLEGTPLEAEAAAAGPLQAPATGGGGLFGFFSGLRRSGRRRKKENVWDSTLLLVGGGALLLLLIMLVALVWFYTRQSGDQMLQVANDFYQQGSYTNAILNYDRYLEKFPKHSGVSMARVRRGLSQLRQAAEGTNNWPAALATATEVTGQIASEDEFATEGRPDLAALLPKIAEGLAGKAREESDPALVAQAREALALVNKYVPASQQPATRLKDVEALLALTERQIAQGEELKKATAAMMAAVEQGNPQKAYQIRNDLLKQYPRLVDNDELRQAVLAAGGAEQSAVKMISRQEAAKTTELPSTARSVVALAIHRGDKPIDGADGRVVFALAEGAAYGLDAATGKVLWRREVGFATRASGLAFAPTPVSEEPGADALLVDTARSEVLRVEASTGQLRWRHAIEGTGDRDQGSGVRGQGTESPDSELSASSNSELPTANSSLSSSNVQLSAFYPVLAGDRLLVATPSGRIVWVDLDSGSSPGYIQLRQSLSVAPAVDLRRSRIYQVAEHSNLFVLSLDDGKAIETVYLGHEKGSITAPPVVVSRFLVIAENDRAEGGTLHVLSLEADGKGPAVRLLQEVHLNGYVDTPPLVSGTRLLVVTDKADVHVFEVSASKPDAPLAEVAQGKAAEQPTLAGGEQSAGMIRFPLIVGSQVWIADSQLNRYDLQPSKGRLEPKGIENERSVTVQAPVPVGRAVIHVRRKMGLPGVLVSAMPMDGGRAVWETHLAAPLVAEPAVDEAGGKITAVSAIGGVFQLDANAVKGQSVIQQPVVAMAAAEVRRPVSDLVPLAEGLLALATSDGPRQVPVFDPKAAKQFRWIVLPDELDCPPIEFSGGLLAPCKLGQVLLFDPRSGQKRAEPFQPRLASGVEVDWRAAAAIGAGEFVLADGRNKLYRVGIKEKPRPNLAKLAEVDLSDPIVSPVAVLGAVAYAVDAADALVAFELPGLTRGRLVPLGGRCVWGPRRVGDRVMLATDDDTLWCLDADQNVVWKAALPYGPLAGAPLATDGGYVLAAAGGVVWRINAATGEEVAKRDDVGYPLATGPVALGSRLLVGGHDGTLYEIEKP